MVGVIAATQIFLDDLILYNLLMNGLLLAVTAYLLRETTPWWRLLLGAGLGSLYLIAFFIPGLQLLTNVLIRLVCPLPMVWIAFPHRRPIQLLRLCGTFYLVAMAAGGVTIGVFYLSRTHPWFERGLHAIQRLPSWLPIAGIMVLFLLMRWFVLASRPLWRRVGREYMIQLTINNQTITFKALLDTGNELKDPISGRPVMIVDCTLLSMLSIPESYSGSDAEVCSLAEQLAESPLAGRVHILPYRTVGRRTGLILALRPDQITVIIDGQERPLPQLLVGVGQHVASSAQSYQALLPVGVAELIASPSLSHTISHAT